MREREFTLLKRIISSALIAVLVFTSADFSVFAAEEENVSLSETSAAENAVEEEKKAADDEQEIENTFLEEKTAGTTERETSTEQMETYVLNTDDISENMGDLSEDDESQTHGYTDEKIETEETENTDESDAESENSETENIAADIQGMSVPNDAVELNGHFYKLFEVGGTQGEAIEKCESLGGHLLTITSEEEQAFINGMIKDCKMRNIWLGARKEDTWGWITGEAFIYTNWDDGEPNNEHNPQNAIMMFTYDGSRFGKWNDENENAIDWPGYRTTDTGFICEWDGITPPGDTTPPQDAVEFNGHFYKLFEVGGTQGQAIEKCESLGGHLLTITSEEEQTFINGMIKDCKMRNIWLGARKEDTWGWITGEAFIYTNWDDGEPNNEHNPQNAIMMFTYDGSRFGKWNDENENAIDWPGYRTTDTGFICEWDDLKDVGLKDAEFDIDIYRADKLSDTTNTESVGMRDRFSYQTPSEIFIDAAQKNGFEIWKGAWDLFTTTFDTLDTPYAFYDFQMEKKDIYSAVILDVLETSTEYGFTEAWDGVIKDSKQFASQMNKLLKAEYDIDVSSSASWKNLNPEEQKIVKEFSEKYYKEIYQPDAASIDKVFSAIGNVVDIAGCIETYIERVSSAIALVNMSDSLKTVIRMMNQKCPESNLYLRLALADCTSIINASTDELLLKLLSDAFYAVGVEITKRLVDELWSGVKANHPRLALLMAVYKSAKYISNELFSTDATIEQYCYMLAIIDVEKLIYDVFQELEKNYKTTGDKAAAAAFLSSIDLMFSARDKDCVWAYKFVDVVDNSTIELMRTLLDKKEAKDRAAVKKNIDGIQRSYSLGHLSVLTAWINYLDEDYPDSGLYEKYKLSFEENKKRFLEKKYVLTGYSNAGRLRGYSRLSGKEFATACPADVYVYDKAGSLAAYVIDNKAYSSGDISVVVDNNIREFYFYNNEEYRIEYVGNDNGIMDISITEYDNSESVLRDVYFYEVPLEKSKIYKTDVDGRTLEEVSYSLNGSDNIVTPDLDTYKPNISKHKINIISGSMIINRKQFFATESYPNELINIHAYIPDGYKFIGWKSDAETDIFTNANSPITTIRMPKKDVTVIARIVYAGSEKSYTVSFNSNGGSSVEEQVVKENKKAVEPLLPTREGYTFAGWYLNGTLYDFDMKVTSDVILEAVWTTHPSDVGGILPEDLPTDGKIPDGLWIANLDSAGYVYTGDAIIPEVRVYDGSTLLAEKTDYTIAFKNNINAGEATVTVTGKGNYSGKETAAFKINQADISGEGCFAEELYVKTGSKRQTPVPALYYMGNKLKAGKDFIAASGVYEKAGRYSMTVTGKGNYKGKKSLTLNAVSKLPKKQPASVSITKASADGFKMSFNYTGEALKQACMLKIDGKTLTEGTDYTVRYTDNTKVGTASVTYYGKNKYSGKLKKTYKILPCDIVKTDYSKTIECDYAKGGAKPKPVVKLNGKTLKEGTDYTLRYKNNTAVNGKQSPCVIISGKGNFKGKISVNFTIKQQDLSKMTLVSCDRVYNGKAGNHKIVPKLMDLDGKLLAEGKDYNAKDITYTYAEDVKEISKKAGDKVADTDIIPAGTKVCVTIEKGTSGNYKGRFTGTYRIVKADIKSAKVTILNKTYTGKVIEIKPEDITVEISGKKLQPGEFEIDPATNKNIAKGKVSVTIKGKGINYGGSKTVTFTIEPKRFLWRRK